MDMHIIQCYMQHEAYQIKTSHMYQFPDNEFKTPFCRAHSVVQISEKLKSVPCLCPVCPKEKQLVLKYLMK